LVHWKLYNHDEEYSEVIARKIYQMEMDLNELFKVLQFTVKVEEQELKRKIMSNVESKILKNVLDLNPQEYESLFKMLSFMRMHDLTPKVTPETVS
jgi:hypothetical protein